MSRWLQSKDKVRDSATRAAHGALDHAVRAFLSPWHFFKVLCFLIGFVVIGATVSGAVYAFNFVRSLPKVDRLDAKSMEIIAKGKVNDRLENKKKRYRWTDIKDVSREYIYAIVMSEDATFFEHSGFNFEAIADSLAENIKERRAAFGGSTISQQVAKNMFLTREKTLNRKIKEVFITRQLEARFTKNEILEMYLNIAELGPDIYGVDAAAWHYFRKSPRNINAAEGVFIALMLPSPK